MQPRIPHASPWIFLAVLFAQSAFAAEAENALANCARIAENKLRLECYDRLAERETGNPQPEPPPPPVVEAAKELENEPFSLAKHWELDKSHKRGSFAFRPHHPNYALLANHTRNPNTTPFLPYISFAPSHSEVSHTELSYQISFKVKLLEDFVGDNDLWFGYTQRSFWQAYNDKASSPFRDTNYQPELMYVVPLQATFLGMRARFLNFGLVHQSNGQTATLSRSWNRAYVQAGLERGAFNILGRLWYRLPESKSLDDNPDILDYMGHGDLALNYRWRSNDFSALLRRNFNTGRGAVQANWAFPLYQKLKGYVQLFSGYGQTLIDYNSYQQSFGIGVTIDF